MTINLYGPLRHVAAIGNFLTTKGISLMAASLVDVGVEVHNPHTGAKAVVPRRFAAGTSANYVNRSVEEIAHDVAGLFDSLAKSESLPEMEADGRVTTPLLAHQKQGLYFMTEREKDHNIHDEDEEATRSLWRLKYSSNGRRTYVHVITGAQQPSRPPDIHGGILGDQMGLGKTLLTLSLIVGSLADGEQWAEIATPATDDGEPLVRCLKTTLLIAPLSVMNNWEGLYFHCLVPLKQFLCFSFHSCGLICMFALLT
jgi:SNF2 family DNA or RNA helicase